MTLGIFSTAGTAVFAPGPADAQMKLSASDEMGASNPLTNRVLEKVRMLQQDEADIMTYNGELASPDGGPPTMPARLLAPIVLLSDRLDGINKSLKTVDLRGDAASVDATWMAARKALGQEPFTKKAFKRLFNAYSDNIWYVNPDRANIYLGGGAAPSTWQTTQYMQRNDALTNIENAVSELDYLLSERKEGTLPEQLDATDLLEYMTAAVGAFQQYFKLAPEKDLKAAREIAAQGAAA